MSNFLKVLRDIALLIARVALGAVLVLHAWRRWGIDGVPAQIAYLTSHGVPYPQYVAWASIIGEAGAGIALIFGVLTPLAAAGVVAEQVLIICWITWRRQPYIADRGYEYNVILAVLALLFLVYGGGRASIDALFRRSRRTPADEVDDAAYP